MLVVIGLVMGAIIISYSLSSILYENNTKTYLKNNREALSAYVKVYGDSLYNATGAEQVQVHITFLNGAYEEVNVEHATIEYILSLYIVRYGSNLYEDINKK